MLLCIYQGDEIVQSQQSTVTDSSVGGGESDDSLPEDDSDSDVVSSSSLTKLCLLICVSLCNKVDGVEVIVIFFFS